MTQVTLNNGSVDSAGSLALKTNGTTTAVTIDTSQNVGIGTSSPLAKLSIGSGSIADANVPIQMNAVASTGSAFIGFNNAGGYGLLVGYDNTVGYARVRNIANTAIAFSTNDTERMRIDTSGNLLIGTTTIGANSSLVTVGGNSGTARVSPRTDNVGYVGDSSQRWQAVYAVNGTIQTSDGREKNTIEDSNLGLAFVQSLRPVSYKWNVGENLVTYDENQNEIVTPRAGVRTHYGFIAQEVQAAIPEGVDFGGFVQEPNDGPMSLRYHEFIGPLVKAIQEQQAFITQLQADVEALKAK